jgi:23S rRNA pseudouridine2605 synthase
MPEIRLQKYLAESGVASRRKSEELIKMGVVSVNGLIVTEMGFKVSENDIVEVDGKRVYTEENKVYIMLNKPTGYVTTVKDQFLRPGVLDLVKDVKERIYPVGRLDYDTSGLILLTNDGDFTYRLTHPKHELDKVYVAEIKGVPNSEELRIFRSGVKIEDYVTSPAKIKILNMSKERSTVEITIHEGRNRQVRKMCESIGHPVISLKRVAVGSLKLDGLIEGKWRYLSGSEIKSLC